MYPISISSSVAIFLMAIISFLGPDHTVNPAGEEDWVSLFEGSSDKGWESMSDSDWQVREGTLAGRQGKILNRWCWTNFELHIRYRGEGHLLFKIGSDQTGHIGFEQPGYEFDLSKGRLSTAGGAVLGQSKVVTEMRQWSELYLTASENLYTIKIDNKQILEASDNSSPLKGRVGFNAEQNGLEVQFVRVRPIIEVKKKNIPAENYYCYVCHANFEYDDPFVVIHEEAEVLCKDCHGPSLDHRSDEDNVVPPDIIYRRPQVDLKCLECHERHEDKEPSSEDTPKNPVCTDCHGEHKVF